MHFKPIKFSKFYDISFQLKFLGNDIKPFDVPNFEKSDEIFVCFWTFNNKP